MKLTPLLICVCLSCAAAGQEKPEVATNYIDVSTRGFFQNAQSVRAIGNVSYYRPAQGSPFYRENWMKGSAALSPDREYQNLWLKLDLFSNKLHFRDIRGEEMICTTPVYSLSMKDSATGQVHSFVHSSFLDAASDLKPQAWLEILADGKAQLFCNHQKTMTETQPYGAGALERRYFTFDVFYLVINGHMQRVKRAKDIAAALSDKEAELKEWMRLNHADKDGAHMVRMVAYYNSLVK
jgi:hypothetical protein